MLFGSDRQIMLRDDIIFANNLFNSFTAGMITILKVNRIQDNVS